MFTFSSSRSSILLKSRSFYSPCSYWRHITQRKAFWIENLDDDQMADRNEVRMHPHELGLKFPVPKVAAGLLLPLLFQTLGSPSVKEEDTSRTSKSRIEESGFWSFKKNHLMSFWFSLQTFRNLDYLVL